jgi:para-aminobenzoate synthetase component 1
VFSLRIERPASVEAMTRALPSRGRFWLDGDPAHPEGRWAFIGAEPSAERLARFGERSPLSLFDALPSGDEVRGDAPLRAGQVPHWIGYIAYDAAWSDREAVGLRAAVRHPRSPLPIVWLGRYEQMIAIDLSRGDVYALAPDEAACARLAELVSRPIPVAKARVGEIEHEDRELHRRSIEHALEAIARGDIYQVNLARRWRAAFDGDPLALWSAMRASAVPLGMYLELDDHAVLARTMERFLRWEGETLWTSPIKGTIARTGDDARAASALIGDDKERAEHAMIVDLMRNDLSRIAEVGTVSVESALRVEPFGVLAHLVSTVRCRPRREVGIAEILEATFPPGSITGTPKLSAMELIEREERCARGVYTGALGYVDRAGGLSLAVAIRTALVFEGSVSYYAGGGLVSASDPDREIAETELKADVFFDACARVSGKKRN